MQTLGYHPLFALARFLKYFVTGSVTGRIGALYMLYYYLTYKPKSEGYDSMYSEKIRKYVRKKQVDRLKKMFFGFKYIWSVKYQTIRQFLLSFLCLYK